MALAKEARRVVAALARQLSEGLARAEEAAQDVSPVRVPAPRPIVLFDALLLGRRLEDVFTPGGAESLAALAVEAPLLVEDAFAKLAAHHAALRARPDETRPVWPL